MMRIELGTLVILIVEPGNLKRLRRGNALAVDFVKPAEKMLIMFTPDLAWIGEQIKLPENTPLRIDKLLEIQMASLMKPEVMR